MGRKILYIVGGLIAVLVLIALILPFVIDVNQFRPQIESVQPIAPLNRKGRHRQYRSVDFLRSVSVQDIAVSTTRAFGNKTLFLTAKSVTVGVELMPLIFLAGAACDQQLTTTRPQVVLAALALGAPEFLDARRKAAAKPSASSGTGNPSGGCWNSNAAPSVSVQHFDLTNGKITIGDVGSDENERIRCRKPKWLPDLSVHHTVSLSAIGQNSGQRQPQAQRKRRAFEPDGRAADPFRRRLFDLQNFDALSRRIRTFLVPASRRAAMSLLGKSSKISDGQKLTSKGKIQASKLQLVAGGSPAKKALDVDYGTRTYVLKTASGTLNQGDVHIGSALAHLTGTFGGTAEAMSIQMKLDGQNMPATDLEAMLPALEASTRLLRRLRCRAAT